MHFRVLLLQLIFEGNLEDQTGFISIGALYFINGYCSPEPEVAARRGKEQKIRELITNRVVEILAEFIFGVFNGRDKVKVHIKAKKDGCYFPATPTK